MPRSSSPLNIFHDPDPTRKPFLVGKVPSQAGGRSLTVGYGYDQDGNERFTTSDRGYVHEDNDPHFYLYVFGGLMEMSKKDLSECVDEMQYTAQRKRAERERNIASSQDLKNKIGDLIEAVKDAKVARKRF